MYLLFCWTFYVVLLVFFCSYLYKTPSSCIVYYSSQTTANISYHSYMDTSSWEDRGKRRRWLCTDCRRLGPSISFAPEPFCVLPKCYVRENNLEGSAPVGKLGQFLSFASEPFSVVPQCYVRENNWKGLTDDTAERPEF